MHYQWPTGSYHRKWRESASTQVCTWKYSHQQIPGHFYLDSSWISEGWIVHLYSRGRFKFLLLGNSGRFYTTDYRQLDLSWPSLRASWWYGGWWRSWVWPWGWSLGRFLLKCWAAGPHSQLHLSWTLDKPGKFPGNCSLSILSSSTSESSSVPTPYPFSRCGEMAHTV